MTAGIGHSTRFVVGVVVLAVSLAILTLAAIVVHTFATVILDAGVLRVMGPVAAFAATAYVIGMLLDWLINR